VLSRLPIVLSRDEATGKWHAEWDESSMWATSVDGGRSVMETTSKLNIVYIGSPGRYVPREEQPAVAELLATFRCYPVFVDPWDLHDAYMEYTKTTLWPLLHNELPTQTVGVSGQYHYRRAKEAWSAYQIVNTLFANEIKARLGARDLVWVHGHHLLLLPERLSRECRQNNVPIGLYVHTPFPSNSIFSALPQRKIVLGAMLHASIIGFHLYEYARNFMISCRRLLGLVEPTRPTQNMSRGMLGLAWQSRQIVITVAHVGIEPSIVEARATSESVTRRARALRDALNLDGKIVLGGVEWLSSMQGTALKLTAYENLLESYDKWRGRVTLVQVCKPVPYKVDKGAEVAAECRAIAERVRMRFGEDALHYVEVGANDEAARRVSSIQVTPEEWDVNMRVAVWSIVDILIVSATRDGLNLLPFEYVSVRDKLRKGGMCVLSEFAGCSRVLNGAIRVNPFSLTSIIEGIDRALSQSRGDSDFSLQKDIQFVSKNTTASWVELFVKDLKRVQIAETERAESGIPAADADGLPPALSRAPSVALLLPRKLDVEMLVRAYRTATRRVLCFGLDGTLIPQDTVITHLKENHDFTGRGQAPSPAMLHCLRTLAADPANDVSVLSGRGASDMQAILGGVHRLGLAAELGFLRHAGDPWPLLHGGCARLAAVGTAHLGDRQRRVAAGGQGRDALVHDPNQWLLLALAGVGGSVVLPRCRPRFWALPRQAAAPAAFTATLAVPGDRDALTIQVPGRGAHPCCEQGRDDRLDPVPDSLPKRGLCALLWRRPLRRVHVCSRARARACAAHGRGRPRRRRARAAHIQHHRRAQAEPCHSVCGGHAPSPLLPASTRTARILTISSRVHAEGERMPAAHTI